MNSFIAAILGLSQFSLCFADLRSASQPRRGFKVFQEGRRRYTPFNTTHAIYMEPSDFNYNGLKNERRNNYDNFLRSNIDNEQDKRNFDNEDGKDHLPFRTYEGAVTDKAERTIETKIPDSLSNITATPGEAVLVPLRWNNPHASELEINIWIVDDKYVVPVRKPTCSGEGYQDNAITFTVPKDFNDLGGKVPGFKGCKAVGDCVLQIYSHSVESRTYSHGTPIIVTGDVTGSATSDAAVKAAGEDPALNLKKLRVLCRPSNDPDANIKSAVAYKSRLISDVFNHAYQNSDYSPYSGQQPDDISQNLQASVIIQMIPGNRGELGKEAFRRDNREGYNYQRQLLGEVRRAYKRNEGIANSLIGRYGRDMAEAESMMGPAKNQEAETKMQKTTPCFRCQQVGATSGRRLTTTTYIPSFKIPEALLGKVLSQVGGQYKELIRDDGTVPIYSDVVEKFQDKFAKAASLNVNYMGPNMKDTKGTKDDATNFKKRDANGRRDNGLYAGRTAYKKAGVKPWADSSSLVETDFKLELGAAASVGKETCRALQLEGMMISACGEVDW